MTYYIKEKVEPLFTINIDYLDLNKSSANYTISLTSNYKVKSVANDVKVKIPVPCDSIEVKYKSLEN